MIEWQNKRYIDFLTIRGRVSSISAGLALKIGYDKDSRAMIGFSEDRKFAYIKKSINGVKLSLINNRSNGRTFSSIALITQYGKDIIGRYELDNYNEEDDIATLRKV